ncbi:MAG: hypothetical protein WDA18_07800 [Candidatus Ratteibacteria bacterium]|jgi:hypothetical protein
MRKLFTIPVLLTLLLTPLFAQSKESSANQEIRSFCNKIGKHFASNNMQAALEMVPSETILSFKNGTTMTAVQAKKYLFNTFPGCTIQKGSFSLGSIQIKENRAETTIKSSFSFLPATSQNTTPYRVTSEWKSLFTRISGKWIPTRFDQQTFSITLNGKEVSIMPGIPISP